MGNKNNGDKARLIFAYLWAYRTVDFAQCANSKKLASGFIDAELTFRKNSKLFLKMANLGK